MTRRKRRNHSPVFKAQVATAALKGDKTLAELAQQLDIHPNQIADWKTQLMERSAQVFGDAAAKAIEPDIKTMQAKIGQLTLENDFLENALTKAGLLSARRGLTAPTTCRSFGNARSCLWRGRPLTTPRNRPHPPISPSCDASTNCIWNTLLPAAGCSAVCSDWKASQSEESLCGP